MNNREHAVNLVNKHIKTPHIILHSYAVEAIMKSLSQRLLPEKETLWGIAGLLHDLDEDLVDWKTDMSLHGPKTIEILKKEKLGDDEMYHAILSHNPKNGTKPENIFDYALYAADPMAGFITAITLVYPDKKLKSVKVKSIIKRMKEKRFAAGANRDAMNSIVNTGLSFEEFAEVSLAAMCKIDELLCL
ncbi:MAG: HD domain-containing protein [Filifactoraceae bacterium]